MCVADHSPETGPSAADAMRPFGRSKNARLLVNPKIHDVVVLHHVGALLEAGLAGVLGLLLTARRDKIGPANHVRADSAIRSA